MNLYGQLNTGGLAREELEEENVGVVGFGSYEGMVIASHAWDGLIQTLNLPPARPGSVEDISHSLVSEKGTDFYLSFDRLLKSDPDFQDYLWHWPLVLSITPFLNEEGTTYRPSSPSAMMLSSIFMKPMPSIPLKWDLILEKFLNPRPLECNRGACGMVPDDFSLKPRGRSSDHEPQRTAPLVLKSCAKLS